MLNVSWAKKRAEFVFVFAIRERGGGRERERESAIEEGKSEERGHDRRI